VNADGFAWMAAGRGQVAPEGSSRAARGRLRVRRALSGAWSATNALSSAAVVGEPWSPSAIHSCPAPPHLLDHDPARGPAGTSRAHLGEPFAACQPVATIPGFARQRPGLRQMRAGDWMLLMTSPPA
jgi:hypothetical protein